MIKLICEVGYNHIGNIDKAVDIVDAFWDSCDVFKFQKMHPKTFLKKRYNEKSPNKKNYLSENYGEHRDKLELSVDDHKEIQYYIESQGKAYACSVHDLQSAKKIIPLNPEYIKIASCNCNNWKLIDYCLDNFDGFLHVSTGMTTKKERRAVITHSNNIIPYSCTSCYTGGNEIYIERMAGFSCHSTDITFAKAAIMNGAKYIEFHCTLDRDVPAGNDPRISLLPKDYADLKKWIKKNKKEINRMRFKKPFTVPVSEMQARKRVWYTG